MRPQQQRTRRRHKPPITLAPIAHDRIAVDLPAGAMVAPIDVIDPWSHPEDVHVEHDSRGNEYQKAGALITVARSLRDDPLAGMHARRSITDLQFAAGRRYQMLWERSTADIKAMDFSKEPVDGGGMKGDSLSDHQLDAITGLRQADVVLGDLFVALVRDVLIQGLTFAGIAAQRGGDRRHWAFMLCRGLDELAHHFGLLGHGGNRKRAIQGWRNLNAVPTAQTA